jgi:myo-inositol 2-dehydrogenase/D-chiro-inositol 1-dehydrogenase
MAVGVGVIGAGIMGAGHARTLARHVQGCTLIGIADADEARATSVAAECGTRVVPADDLIADAAVEMVVVASPDATHPAYVRACLERGKPVLCEKPLAPTAGECMRLVEAEAKGGRRLVTVGFMRRFDPWYGDLQSALLTGTYGRALLLHCAHRNVAAPPWFTPEMAISNSAVHEFDIIRWLTGEDIVAVTTLRSAPKGGGQGRDPIMMLVELESGILADVEVFIAAAYGYDIRTEMVCEFGTLELGRPGPGWIRHAGTQGISFPADWLGRFQEAYRLELQAWVDAYRKDAAAPGASAWDGYMASLVSDAALASLESGRRVQVATAQRPALYAR